MKDQSTEPPIPGRPFYRIVETHDGLVDIWLSPGEAVPIYDAVAGRTEIIIRVLAARGVNPKAPEWGGDLEEHIRRNYYAWIKSAEEMEI